MNHFSDYEIKFRPDIALNNADTYPRWRSRTWRSIMWQVMAMTLQPGQVHRKTVRLGCKNKEWLARVKVALRSYSQIDGKNRFHHPKYRLGSLCSNHIHCHILILARIWTSGTCILRYASKSITRSNGEIIEHPHKSGELGARRTGSAWQPAETLPSLPCPFPPVPGPSKSGFPRWRP